MQLPLAYVNRGISASEGFKARLLVVTLAMKSMSVFILGQETRCPLKSRRRPAESVMMVRVAAEVESEKVTLCVNGVLEFR